MQVIELKEPYDQDQIPQEPLVMAAGFFDGVHLGHQKVIKTAAYKARVTGLKLAVLTFDVYPKMFFQKVKDNRVKYLTTNATKAELMAELGVDYLFVVRFDKQMMKMPPQEFVDKYFAGLHTKYLVAGEDFTYGKHEVASMKQLSAYAKNRFRIISVTHLKDQAGKVGSTRIRQLLDQGNVFEANRLLGRPYATHGQIVHGFRRGHLIGFPTINIDNYEWERIPGEGVYAVKVKIEDSKWIMGMASIGHNDTFGDDLKKTIEINLFNFNQDVYGKQVTVEWYYRLRPMIKFASVGDLVSQLKADREKTRALFRN